MPKPGMLWRHLVINTHGTWLHGDKRGFRSRGHRIHSSGDYKNPPPPEEHAGLRRYHKQRCPTEVTIRRHLRPVIGRMIAMYFLSERYRVLCVVVGKVHAHAGVELPQPLPTVKRIVGEAKRCSSCAVTTEMPGTVWSANGEFVPVYDRDHLQAAYEYDLYKQGSGAWSWSYRDGSLVGVFGRRRPEPKQARARAKSRVKSGAAQSLPRRVG